MDVVVVETPGVTAGPGQSDKFVTANAEVTSLELRRERPEIVPYAEAASWLLERPLALSRRRFDALVAALVQAKDGVGIPRAAFLYDDNGEECERDYELTADGLAMIPVHGILVHRDAGIWGWIFGLVSYEEISAQIDAALADSAVKAIVLDVDSPGGEVEGLFDFVDRISAGRRKKPMYALSNENAFSAAYAIASAADSIFLTRTAGVGSIGVIAQHVSFAEWEKKQGIKVTAVFAGDRKNDGSPHEPLSSEARATLQAEVDKLYDLFVATVARNRPKLSTEAVRATEAGLYFGADAVAAGLADSLGSVEDAMAQIRSRLASSQRSISGGATMSSAVGGVVAAVESSQNPSFTLEFGALAQAGELAQYVEATVAEASKAAVAAALAGERARIEAIAMRCEAVSRPDVALKLIREGISAEDASARLTDEMAKSSAPEIHGATSPIPTGESSLVKDAKRRAEAARPSK